MEKLYSETYKDRLKHRQIDPEFKEMKEAKELLFEINLENSKNKKSKPWNIEQLEVVLKSLKKNKARDPHGLVNELFRPEVAGEGLKQSLLKLFNGAKENIKVPI